MSWGHNSAPGDHQAPFNKPVKVPRRSCSRSTRWQMVSTKTMMPNQTPIELLALVGTTQVLHIRPNTNNLGDRVLRKNARPCKLVDSQCTKHIHRR